VTVTWVLEDVSESLSSVSSIVTSTEGAGSLMFPWSLQKPGTMELKCLSQNGYGFTNMKLDEFRFYSIGLVTLNPDQHSRKGEK